MSPFKGSDFAMQVGRSGDATAFDPVEGLRLSEIRIANQAVELCDGCPTGWRSVIAQAGSKRVSVTAQGIFLGSAAEIQLRTLALSGDVAPYRMLIDREKAMSGKFVIEALTYRCSSEEETHYELVLASSGEIIIA